MKRKCLGRRSGGSALETGEDHEPPIARKQFDLAGLWRRIGTVRIGAVRRLQHRGALGGALGGVRAGADHHPLRAAAAEIDDKEAVRGVEYLRELSAEFLEL